MGRVLLLSATLALHGACTRGQGGGDEAESGTGSSESADSESADSETTDDSGEATAEAETDDGQTCAPPNEMCGDNCTNTASDDMNCGSCGNECLVVEDFGIGGCFAGECQLTFSECVNPGRLEMLSCDQVCTSQGGTCLPMEEGGACFFNAYAAQFPSADDCETLNFRPPGADVFPALNTCEEEIAILADSYRCCCKFD